MKKYSAIIMALLASSFAMCKPTPVPVDDKEREADLVASFEKYTDESGKEAAIAMKWHKKDAITVISAAGYTKSFSTSQKSSTALFYGDIKGEPKYAFYPDKDDNILRDNIMTFELPATQAYEAGALAQNVNVAVAAITDPDEVVFRNVCGLFEMKLSVGSGNINIGKIVLTDNSMPLCGVFKTDLGSTNPVAKFVRDGESDITLECGGVALGTTPTSFYFVLPEGSLEDGFDAIIYNSDNRIISSMSVKSDCSIEHGCLTSYSVPALNWIPTGYSELPYLESNGKNYIDTEFKPASGDSYQISYTPTALTDGVVMGCEEPDGAIFHLAQPMSNTIIASEFSTGGSKQSMNIISYQGGDTINQNVTVNNSRNQTTVQVKKVSASGSQQTSQTQTISTLVTIPGKSLYIMASNNGKEAVNCYSGKFNYAIVSNDGVVKAYFIPCQRSSDAQKGVYEIMSGKFCPTVHISGSGETREPININIENDLTQEYWNYVLAHPYDESDYSYSYMKDYYKQSVSYKKDWPRAAELSWTPIDEATSQTLIVSRDENFTDIYLSKTLGSKVSATEVYNFLPNETYWYRVNANLASGNSENIINGKINTTGRRRVIRVDQQVFNVRDFGGLPIGGSKHIRYEQIYRGGRWNGNGTVITTEGKENLKQVGILAELDLRSQTESESRTTSPGGSQIEYKRFSNSGSTNLFGQYYYEKCNNGDIFIQALQYMIDKIKEGKPVYMHCSIGADRTGTLAVLTEGLLGVDACNICMDWELTSLALVTAAPGDDLRSRYRPECSQNFYYEGLWKAVVNNHPGSTTQEKFYHYFNKGYKGDGTGATISSEDLDWFINYMTVDNN